MAPYNGTLVLGGCICSRNLYCSLCHNFSMQLRIEREVIMKTKLFSKCIALLCSFLLLVGTVGFLAPLSYVANAGTSSESSLFIPGVYEGTSVGHNGPLTVEVTVDENEIKDIIIKEDYETKTLSDVAKERIPSAIISNQSLRVDTVTAATLTSYAIIRAVRDALKDACSNLDLLNKEIEKEIPDPIDRVLDVDVVVVGAGLAGCNAALKAKEEGAGKVILLEKLSFVGGNSMLSSGVVTLGGTSIQAKAGIVDTAEDFFEYAMTASKGKRDETQTRMITSRAGETMEWMLAHNAPFSDQVSPIMGSPIPRAHLAFPNSVALTNTMAKAATDAGVQLMLETPATKLIVENDVVKGVLAKSKDNVNYTINAKKVILASGGYGANQELFYEWTPAQRGVIFAGCIGCTGEMAVEAVNIGADTIHLEVPFTTPTVQLPHRKIITSLVLSKGAIITNNAGERFCDETKSYAETSAAVIATGEDHCWEIFDDSVREQLPKVDEYIRQDMFIIADSIEELCELTGLPLETLSSTIEAYNKGVTGEDADPFGRTIVVNPLIKAPFYAAKVMPGTPMTNGGLRVDEVCRVVRKDGSVIEGLYAAGEITGGYCAFGYVGGDAMGRAAVMGMVAGEDAARSLK